MISTDLSATCRADKSITQVRGPRRLMVIRPHHREIKHSSSPLTSVTGSPAVEKNTHTICLELTWHFTLVQRTLKMAPSQYILGIKLALLPARWLSPGLPHWEAGHKAEHSPPLEQTPACDIPASSPQELHLECSSAHLSFLPAPCWGSHSTAVTSPSQCIRASG